MILESRHSLFLLQNPKSAIPGSVYQREGISSLKGRVRKTEHPLGIRSCVSVPVASPETGFRQVTQSRPSFLSCERGCRTGGPTCFCRGSREYSGGIWTVFKNKHRGVLCFYIHGTGLPCTFEREEGDALPFSLRLLLSVRG